MAEITAPIDDAPHPDSGLYTKAYRNGALALLVVIYTLNFLDRQIITTVGEAIKNDLQLSDTQLGALGGIFFAALYTIVGLPIARLADKRHRPWIMTISVAVWSGFTVLSGLARNYLVLAVARAGVGIGEAGCSPTAHSLLADYFPKDGRAAALGVYSMGISIGTLLGMALGGIIAENFGWRVAFYVAGLPGLLFAVVALLVLREPRAELTKEALRASNAANHLPLTTVMAALEQRATFWWFAFGGAFASMVSYAHGQFFVGLFLRNRGAEIAELAARFGMSPPPGEPPLGFLALVLGLLAGFGGGFGAWWGGRMADRWGSKNIRNFALLPTIFPIVSIPLLWYIFNAQNMALAFALLLIPNIGVGVWWGPVYGGVQTMMPPAMRALSAAVLLFVINMLGLGVGPTAFGAVSDFMANRQLVPLGLDLAACRTAADQAACAAASAYGVKMAAYVSTAIIPLSMLCFFMSRFSLKRDMDGAGSMPARPMGFGRFALYFAAGFGAPGAFLARALSTNWMLGLLAGVLLGVAIASVIVAGERRRLQKA
jgi:MFS family permease